MHELLWDDSWCAQANEVNEIKLLFGPHQSWTKEQARSFTTAAIERLVR
jgi:hypothetical protein